LIHAYLGVLQFVMVMYGKLIGKPRDCFFLSSIVDNMSKIANVLVTYVRRTTN